MGDSSSKSPLATMFEALKKGEEARKRGEKTEWDPNHDSAPSAVDCTSEGLPEGVGTGYILKTESSKYIFGRRLGSGGFGRCFSAYLATSPDSEVAIKSEPKDTTLPQLFGEYGIYKVIRRLDENSSPRVIEYSEVEGNRYLVLELMEQSVEQKLKRVGGNLSARSAALVGLRMLERLQLLHSGNYVHCDVKPDNFLLRKGDGTIHLSDFGLAREYLDVAGRHMRAPKKHKNNRCGTGRFMSIAVHEGNVPTRRDDIESLGYTIIYLMKGELPWQGATGKHVDRESRYEFIHKAKVQTSLEQLTEGLPDVIKAWISYSRAMTFDEVPDYSRLESMLSCIANQNGLTQGSVLWEPDRSIRGYSDAAKPACVLEEQSSSKSGNRNKSEGLAAPVKTNKGISGLDLPFDLPKGTGMPRFANEI